MFISKNVLANLSSRIDPAMVSREHLVNIVMLLHLSPKSMLCLANKYSLITLAYTNPSLLHQRAYSVWIGVSFKFSQVSPSFKKHNLHRLNFQLYHPISNLNKNLQVS